MSEGRRKYDDILNELRAKQENLGDYDGDLRTRAADSSPLHGPLVSDFIGGKALPPGLGETVRLGPTGPTPDMVNAQNMGQSGMPRARKYDDVLAQLRAAPAEPEPPAPAPIQAPQPSMLDRFLGAGGEAMQTGADTLRGGIRGLTAGYGDKLEAGVRSAMPGGGSYADEFARQNAYHDEAAARSPYGYNIGKTLGGAPWDLAAAVAGAPGGLAGEVATSGALGAFRGAGMSRSPSLEGTLEDANRGGAEGTLWGLGGGVAGRAIGAGSDALTGLAPRARASALGEIGPAARAQRKLKGDEYVENLPQAADDLGLTPPVPMDWRHPVDSIRQKLTFNKPGDYAEAAQGLMDDVHGPAKGAAVQEATAQGVSVPHEELMSSLEGSISSQPRNFKRAPYESAMRRNMTDVPEGTPSPDAPPQLAADQMDRLKMDWASGGYKDADSIQTVSEAIPARASRDASNIAGRHLGDAIDTMATDDVARNYRTANDGYEKSASIANMAREAQLGLDTQSPFALPNVGRTLGGVAGGAAIGGQVAGIPGAVLGGVGGFLGNKAMQNYGPDVMADFLRSGPGMRDAAVGGTLGGAVAGPPGAVAGAVVGGLGRGGVQAGAGAGQSVYGARDRGMPDSDMTSRFINSQQPQAQSPQDSLEQGRGYALTEAALDALQNDPQALGRFAQEIAQAAGGEPGAVSAVITRLSRTDPEFRTTVLPALRARTGGM